MSVIVMCGSMRFRDAHGGVEAVLIGEGHTVLSVGSPRALWGDQGYKHHCRLIDLADRVMVVDPGGYIGQDTWREIDYARAQSKPVDHLWELDYGWVVAPFDGHRPSPALVPPNRSAVWAAPPASTGSRSA